ncbi:MAG: hypothetical protein V8S86_10065 [Eubacteriales bacterium]
MATPSLLTLTVLWTATVVPTSASTEANKVMAKPTITGTKNDDSVAGQTLTIVLGENGELTVAYVYDKYDLTGADCCQRLPARSRADVKTGMDGVYRHFMLTQKTAAELATGKLRSTATK